MGTPFAVVGSNLVVGYLEIKMFSFLPQIYPKDFVDYFIRNYFRFLDDIFHKWLSHFDIEPFIRVINELDEDLKFIMDEHTSQINFLDVMINIENNQLKFDIYYKPTNAFSYLKYSSCHPSHTKNNIAISLAKRIIRIVSDNTEKRLAELKEHLENRGHPSRVIEYAYTKVFQPKYEDNEKEVVSFIHTHNPNHQFNVHKIKHCIYNLQGQKMKKTFENCKIITATRQPQNLKKLLTRSKFQLTTTIARSPRIVGLFPCGKCTYCYRGYIKQESEFTLRRNNRIIKWVYTRYFSCDSVNVLYFAESINDGYFYLGKTKNVKHRIAKHISDVNHPENSNCKKCAEHIRMDSKLQEPYLKFHPFFYVDDPHLRAFMEARFIKRFKPQLNGYLVN